jgi:hypothetical protein
VCPCVSACSYVACQCAHARVNVSYPKVAAVDPVPSDQEECMHSLAYAGQSYVGGVEDALPGVSRGPSDTPRLGERPHGRIGVPGSCGVFLTRMAGAGL